MSNQQYSAHGCYLLGGICWFNDWRADVESWMKEEKLPSYYLFLERAANGEKVCYQKAHCMVRSGFSSYCHHLAGCKYLLHMLLQLPILAQCSAANPERAEIPALTKWITDLQRQKQTKEYNDAVRESKPALTTIYCRLSLQIREASRKLSKAKALSRKRNKGLRDDLTQEEQCLVEAYDSGRLDRRMQNLISQQTPSYKSEQSDKHKSTAAVIAATEPDSDAHPVPVHAAQTSSSTARSATPSDHPKPVRVDIPALIELEAGHFVAAAGMVYEAHLTRGFQLEQDMQDAKKSFNEAQASRAVSIATTPQAAPLTLTKSPTVVNLKQHLKQRLKQRHLEQRVNKGQRRRQPRRGELSLAKQRLKQRAKQRHLKQRVNEGQRRRQPQRCELCSAAQPA